MCNREAQWAIAHLLLLERVLELRLVNLQVWRHVSPPLGALLLLRLLELFRPLLVVCLLIRCFGLCAERTVSGYNRIELSPTEFTCVATVAGYPAAWINNKQRAAAIANL